MHSIPHLRSGFIVYALLIGAVSVANEDAQESEIVATADRLELNQQTGIQTLSGNVTITQQDIVIQADAIEVTISYGAISRIVGTGSPIRFRQRLVNNEVFSTESQQIDYQTRNWTIVFSGDVNLQRTNWQLNAPSVEYNIRNKNFKATNSSESDTPSSTSDSRVIFTYNN